MGWLGRVLGGLIGFYLGGPFGMIAGAVFGSMFDKSSDVGQDQQSFFRNNVGYNRSQMVFFVGAFSMLAKLAEADGQVSESARRKVHEFMINDLYLTGQSYQYANSIFEQALHQNSTFEDLADQFYENFRTSPQLLQMMIDIFYRVALSDGRISSNEEKLIDYACRRFNIPESILDSIRRKYRYNNVSSKAYAVLGLTESATNEEIKKAYRKLILEYHPDTVASKGMAEEFKEYATKRFREIQEAYEAISKERGIK